MYSQNEEEKHIVEYFKDRPGRFLDIGAYNGQTFSNTRRLVEIGWTGVLVEPCPKAFVDLANFCGNSEKLDLVNCAISTTAGLKKLWMTADAVSTIDENHRRLWAERAKYRKIWINTVTPAEIIQMFGKEYDFVNIDAEGVNVQIFVDLLQAGMTFDMICIEHDGKAEFITQTVGDYTVKHQNGENLILAR